VIIPFPAKDVGYLLREDGLGLPPEPPSLASDGKITSFVVFDVAHLIQQPSGFSRVDLGTRPGVAIPPLNAGCTVTC